MRDANLVQVRVLFWRDGDHSTRMVAIAMSLIAVEAGLIVGVVAVGVINRAGVAGVVKVISVGVFHKFLDRACKREQGRRRTRLLC